MMADYQFTVTQTGIICVEADSEEEARSILESSIELIRNSESILS